MGLIYSFFTFTGYQGTNSHFGHLGYTGREQLPRSLSDKKAYCPIEVIIHSRLTVFRMLGSERMPWLGYSVLELSLTVLNIAAIS